MPLSTDTSVTSNFGELLLGYIVTCILCVLHISHKDTYVQLHTYLFGQLWFKTHMPWFIKTILHFWKHFTTSFNSVVNALSNEVCIVDKT